MKLRFVVEIDVSHVNGPYCSKEDMAEVLIEELESNMPSDVAVQDSNYDVVDSSVTYTK